MDMAIHDRRYEFAGDVLDGQPDEGLGSCVCESLLRQGHFCGRLWTDATSHDCLHCAVAFLPLPVSTKDILPNLARYFDDPTSLFWLRATVPTDNISQCGQERSTIGYGQPEQG